MTQKWNVIHDDRPVLTQRTREQCLQYVEGYYSHFEQAAVHLWELKQEDHVISTVKLEKMG